MKFADKLYSRQFALLFLVSFASILHAAPKVQVTITTDRSDAIYKQRQPITFSILATQDGQPMMGQSVAYKISKDGAATMDEGRITLADKPVTIITSLNEPGFVKLFVSVPGHLVYKNR